MGKARRCVKPRRRPKRIAAFRLPDDSRRRQLQHRQAAARRLAAKTGEDRQEDRRLGVVGGGDAPGMPRLRRIERRGRRLDDPQRCAPIPFRRQNGGDYLIPALTLRDELTPQRVGFAMHLE
ncbi:putative transcriptional regulator domain protein [Pseudomonas aeruginosa]|nr:putative transcriptional regulator domain protein [Pseudomonas aeruginosa]EFQ37547.1 hypothetical protein PA39016_000210050 [Pseudomonas aeruginosa 39016]CDH78494.1 hypothetical protein PAMH27_4108 [Pseudomonas aeruginosa MH27]BAK88956.1 hypothetical protein NCGM2_2097 [Pseudomonas aeruginosa NCGM2.S1]AWF64718.1 putative transcriptional regulator domain protein [Pseudomonas aeruginosa]